MTVAFTYCIIHITVFLNVQNDVMLHHSRLCRLFEYSCDRQCVQERLVAGVLVDKGELLTYRVLVLEDFPGKCIRQYNGSLFLQDIGGVAGDEAVSHEFKEILTDIHRLLIVGRVIFPDVDPYALVCESAV